MKPAAFDYVAPATVDEALDALAAAPEQTRLLAGGQSLVPQLNLRDVRPRTLVDLNRVPELARVERDGERIRVGAMVRQRTLERDEQLAAAVPLLREAVRHVAHPAVRTRGTIGGSLAHADPAAELPAATLALDATVVVRGVAGERRVPVGELFQAPFSTAIAPDEILVALELPLPPAGSGMAFEEVARFPGGPAQAGAAALVTLEADGRIADARLALCAVARTPVALDWVADALAGEPPSEEPFAALARRVAESVDPTEEPEHRRALAGLVAERALTAAAERAGRTA